jgi:alanine dehydrogenase
MIVGILKEIKPAENRVGMTPSGAETLISNGHTVIVEKNAGANSGLADSMYKDAGCRMVDTPQEIFRHSDMVMHVKEPQPQEYSLIREDQIVFTYLHLAAEKELTQALIKSGCIAVAYETIQKSDGSLPLLTPMSEVAGRMSVQVGARFLEMTYGGEGVLLGGVTGVEPATVLVIGGGTVGENATKMACGLGAKVYILDTSIDKIRRLSDVMPKNCFPLMSSPQTLRKILKEADLVIGAVLIAGAKAPKIITRDMLAVMKKGAVMVDVAIDQGGCFETSRPTSHNDPVFEVDGIIHYCVTNMPGAVARTSTIALTNATLPYALELANKGWRKAASQNPEIAKGINIAEGGITYKAVADAFSMPVNTIF